MLKALSYQVQGMAKTDTESTMSATFTVASRIWKYPRTPYWPYSPAQSRDADVHADPERFVARAVVVAEKLDGSNTLLHRGEVYARSVSAPATAKWLAMVRKHSCVEGHRTGDVSLRRGNLRRAQHRVRSGAGGQDILCVRATFRRWIVRFLSRAGGVCAGALHTGGAGAVRGNVRLGAGSSRLLPHGARRVVGSGRSTGGNRDPPCGGIPGCRLRAQRVQERSRGSCAVR